MMVLTGIGDFSYQWDDGVYVVPIGCLKDWVFDIKNFIEEDLVNFRAKAAEVAE